VIREVRIKNFQSHENTVVRFSPTQTVIVGSSDCGKSSIIRAINWVRRNRPLGTSFIRTGSLSPCRVEIDLVQSDGSEVTIEREKSSKTSFYKIGHEVYQALRSDVPEPVKELLNLSDINVQLQLDQHFLILETPGEIAKRVNSITKIEEADKVLQRLNSKCRETNTTIQIEKDRVENLKAEQNQFCYTSLVEFEELLTLLSGCRSQMERVSKLIELLSSLCKQIETNASYIWTANVALNKLRQVDDLAGRFTGLETSIAQGDKRYQALSQLVIGIDGCDTRLRKIEEQEELQGMVVSLLDEIPQVEKKVVSLLGKVKSLTSLESSLKECEYNLANCCRDENILKKEVTILTPLPEIVSRIVDRREKCLKLTSSMEKIVQCDEEVRKTDESLKVETGVRGEVLSQIEVCPLCDSKLDEAHKKQVVERLS